VIGAIGGIADIARDAFGRDGAARDAR